MQNLFFKRILLVGFVLTMSIQSCTNLEEELYSDITADNFFKTDEEFIAALGQAYASFGGLGNHGNLWSMNEISSDELVITTKEVPAPLTKIPAVSVADACTPAAT